MRKIVIWKIVASFTGGAAVFIAESFLPVSWSWAKYAFPVLVVIWLISLWQVYEWPFVRRFYSKFLFYLTAIWTLLTKHKRIYLASFEAQTVRIVKGKEQAEIEDLERRVKALEKTKIKKRIIKNKS